MVAITDKHNLISIKRKILIQKDIKEIKNIIKTNMIKTIILIIKTMNMIEVTDKTNRRKQLKNSVNFSEEEDQTKILTKKSHNQGLHSSNIQIRTIMIEIIKDVIEPKRISNLDINEEMITKNQKIKLKLKL